VSQLSVPHPGPEGKKRLHWAFNFIQTLSELAEDRPDLFSLVVSVRDNTTDAFQQIHRKSPVVIDFKGETAREDRKKLVLHRLFQNRSNVPQAEIEQAVHVYATERVRLLHADKTQADKARLQLEVVECWPFAPELLGLLEDHILMAAAAQDSRDFIRMLAEVFRVRGQLVPVVTCADFCVDDDDCGVTTLIDSFATSADQERLREKAIRNLSAIRDAMIDAPHAREVISSIWVRSLSATQDTGATRNEVQLDITQDKPIDDNAFTPIWKSCGWLARRFSTSAKLGRGNPSNAVHAHSSFVGLRLRKASGASGWPGAVAGRRARAVHHFLAATPGPRPIHGRAGHDRRVSRTQFRKASVR
jgi:hypothetical protein